MGDFRGKIRVTTASDFQIDVLNRLVESQSDMMLAGACVDADWLWHQVADQKPEVLLLLWKAELKPALLRRIHMLFPELVIVWLMAERTAEHADEISQIVTHVIQRPFVAAEIAAVIRSRYVQID